MGVVEGEFGEEILPEHGDVILFDLNEFQRECIERGLDVLRCHDQRSGDPSLT